MPIKPRTLRLVTGAGLAVATVATRYPFRGRTLFEFDSVDFAVATFRFNIDQVTPHVPGDILHIWAGRFLQHFTSNINSAFVWLSILLSMGSVLLLWRAGAWLRGERVGLIAAVLWLFNPLFWFTGCVSTAYIHEAFFCSALLYLGVRWIREPRSLWIPPLLAGVLAIAIGARQNDILFFAPAVIWLFIVQRPKSDTIVYSICIFTLAVALWAGDLILEAGSMQTYLAAFARERGLKSQSVLFGNSWRDQLNATAKFLFYLPVAIGPPVAAIFVGLAVWPKRTLTLVRRSIGSRVGLFGWILILPSAIFYFAIYFMKAGYLLTITPVAVLGCAVLVDMLAIWFAERTKISADDRHLLTRPLITRNAIVISAIGAVVNILWFVLPLPGLDETTAFDELTRESFARGVEGRLESSPSILSTIGNRVFSKTNYHGITATDELNAAVDRALTASGANSPNSVIIATWWDRQAYLAMKRAFVYDIQPMGDTIAVGVARELWRIPLNAKSIRMPPHVHEFLLMREDNPDFANVSKQLQLRRLELPPHVDIYEVTGGADTLIWRNARFARRH